MQERIKDKKYIIVIVVFLVMTILLLFKFLFKDTYVFYNTNNELPILHDTYEYMQEGEAETYWTKLILPHNWGYGIVPQTDSGFYGSTLVCKLIKMSKKP